MVNLQIFHVAQPRSDALSQCYEEKTAKKAKNEPISEHESDNLGGVGDFTNPLSYCPVYDKWGLCSDCYRDTYNKQSTCELKPRPGVCFSSDTRRNGNAIPADCQDGGLEPAEEPALAKSNIQRFGERPLRLDTAPLTC